MSEARRLTVDEFARVARQYAIDNPTGGGLHIVVDDQNLADSNVEFCIDFALERGDHYGAALALLMLHMTRTQRGRISQRWYDWAASEPERV